MSTAIARMGILDEPGSLTHARELAEVLSQHAEEGCSLDWHWHQTLKCWMLAPFAPFCLGRTARGMPRHPLYVRRDEPLRAWELR